MILIITINFMCGFYMVANLWVPPKCYLNSIRLIVWFLVGNLAFTETYKDITTWNTQERVNQPVDGQYRWLLTSILCAETFLCYKYRKDGANVTDTPTPVYITLSWILFFLSLYCLYFYLRFKKDRTTKHPQQKVKAKAK